MGTKIEHSINLLATSVESNKFTVSGVNVWEHYQKKGLSNKSPRIEINKLKDPMDRILDRNNVESIKKTMQMHEDIFQHQVRELHRVYSVQKMLMEELTKEMRQKNLWTPMNGLNINQPHLGDHHQQQQKHQRKKIPCGPEFQVQTLRDDERSGSCSGDTIKMQRGFDLARLPPEEEEGEGEAGPSSYVAFQGCKRSSDGSDEEMEIDLTLSIGGGSSSKVKKKTKPHSSASERVGECSDPTTPMSSSSVTFDQERKGTHPHWLSQGLKLKSQFN